MAVLVLDASIALAALLPDEPAADFAVALLARVQREGAMVPRHWPDEVGNGLLMAARRRRIGGMGASGIGASLARLSLLPLSFADSAPLDAWEAPLRLALTHRLTLYDARYLELALVMALPLATLDRELRAAAAAERVPLLPI